jgi:hypothetical protein
LRHLHLPFPPHRADFLVTATRVDREQCHLGQVGRKFAKEPLFACSNA